MTLWYTSDSHFRHANFLSFVNQAGERIRPWEDVRELDELMIQRWNEVVKPEDHVWHLGDVTMLRGSRAHEVEPLLSRLQGHKRLILGNHDHCDVVWYRKWFEKVRASNRLDNILMTHIPVHSDCLGTKLVNMHGHIHERLVMSSPHHPDPRYVNVCVEQTQYRPVALEEIKAMLDRRPAPGV